MLLICIVLSQLLLLLKFANPIQIQVLKARITQTSESFNRCAWLWRLLLILAAIWNIDVKLLLVSKYFGVVG